jgi:hypothetical protein
MKKIIVLLLVILAVIGGFFLYFLGKNPIVPNENIQPPAGIPDLISIESPVPESRITSPLEIKGVARGPWYFEASFPVFLTDWDGKIIAQGIATAQVDPADGGAGWMTVDFVPFTATLNFENPSWDADFSKRGTLIFQKDNPSGLPEHDNAYEMTVWFE